jgi:large subunit ribosomal protein L3
MGPIKGNMKGKNLPGHMGAEKVTIQNLPVVSVDSDNHLLLIGGNVPGPKNGFVMVRAAVKKVN